MISGVDIPPNTVFSQFLGSASTFLYDFFSPFLSLLPLVVFSGFSCLFFYFLFRFFAFLSFFPFLRLLFFSLSLFSN